MACNNDGGDGGDGASSPGAGGAGNRWGGDGGDGNNNSVAVDPAEGGEGGVAFVPFGGVLIPVAGGQGGAGGERSTGFFCSPGGPGGAGAAGCGGGGGGGGGRAFLAACDGGPGGPGGAGAAPCESQALQALSNGDFELSSYACGNDDQCPSYWCPHETRSNEQSKISDVADNGPSLPGNLAWDFTRTPGTATGDFTSIEQSVSIDATLAKELTLRIDVKVFSHSLVAGGTVCPSPSFEWPAHVLIKYLTTAGTPQVWMHGWYLENPGDGDQVEDCGVGKVTEFKDTLVSQNIWDSHEINLLVRLPQVATITLIRVGGSGHDFHSRIDNVVIERVGQQAPTAGIGQGGAGGGGGGGFVGLVGQAGLGNDDTPGVLLAPGAVISAAGGTSPNVTAHGFDGEILLAGGFSNQDNFGFSGTVSGFVSRFPDFLPSEAYPIDGGAAGGGGGGGANVLSEVGGDPIPATSAWSLLVVTLLTMTVGTILLRARHPAVRPSTQSNR